MDKKLSIIVPVYNSDKYIAKCIESIISQKYENIELILIDDGSTDNSLTIMKKYKDKDKRVFVYSNTNHGVSYTRNYGLEKSTGEYITFVDSDDYVDEDMYVEMINTLENEKTDMVICTYKKVIDESISINNKMPKSKKLNGIDEAFTYLKNEQYNYISNIWNKIYLKKKIKNKFNENYYIGEDLLFNCQYLLNTNTIYYMDKPFYNYTIQNSSLSHKVTTKTITAIKAFDEIINTVEKKISEHNIDDLYREQFRFANLIIKKYKKLDEKNKNYIKKTRKKLFFKILKSKNISFIRKIKTILKMYFFK